MLILDDVVTASEKFTAQGETQLIATGNFDSGIVEVLASTDNLPHALIHTFYVPGLYRAVVEAGTELWVRATASLPIAGISVSGFPENFTLIEQLLTEAGDFLITEDGLRITTE